MHEISTRIRGVVRDVVIRVNDGGSYLWLNAHGQWVTPAISRGRPSIAGVPVHRIIAKELCPEWFDGCDVHHIDGDKTNNRVSNLRCLTKAEHTVIHHTGTHWSDEVKEKMSASQKGRKLSEEHKLKLKEAHVGMTGKTHSAETRVLMSKVKRERTATRRLLNER